MLLYYVCNCNVYSDVFEDLKPEGDDPESLIPEPDPEKQNPNQPRRQPILNFTLKIPETPKARGGDVPEMLIPEPEKKTPTLTFSARIHHYLGAPKAGLHFLQ